MSAERNTATTELESLITSATAVPLVQLVTTRTNIPSNNKKETTESTTALLTVVTEIVTDVNRHTYTACVILGLLIRIWTSQEIFGKYPTQNVKDLRGESNVPCEWRDGQYEANSRLSELACKRA